MSARASWDPVEEAKAIVRVTQGYGVTLRIIGGLAIRLHCHGPHSQHLREYRDIDVFGFREQSSEIESVFGRMNYVPNIKYNLLYRAARLQFIHVKSQKCIDVFLDKFIMDHTIDFRPRLRLDDLTIPITDLLLTKLQVVKLNEKDVKDVVAVLEDHELGYVDNHETLNLTYMASLCSRDWGLYKTITENIRKMAGMSLVTQIEEVRNLRTKFDRILLALDSSKKGVKWRIRDLVGERIKWYDEVELGEDEA